MYTVGSAGSLVLKEEEGDASTNQYPRLVEFEETFRNPDASESVNVRQKFTEALKGKFCKCNLKQAVMTYFPIIKTLITYDVKAYLPNDLIAGLIAGIMMIPQGMAFAALSTLPPIVGLYISLFASLTYFLMGTGRQLSWGCIAIFSLMMANILDKYDSSISGDSQLTCINNSIIIIKNETVTSVPISNISDSTVNLDDDAMKRRLEVASGVSVIVGLMLAVGSRIGLSRISALMSDSLITGFSVGVSFHIATSQFKTLLGISVPRYKGPGQLIKTWIALLRHIDETNVATLVTSLICMFIIYVVKRHINERFKSKMRVPIPIELFVVIMGTLASYYGYLNKNHDVTIVGDVPTGIPGPKLPDLSLVTDYIGDALVIIVVSYAQSLAMAKTMGLKHNYDIDVEQEMLACGIGSIICGLFSGYITGASVSRTIVQDGAGGKTQIASLIAALLVLLVIMVIGPYFYFLPKCVLSAIIVINLRSMFLKLLTIPTEWRKSKYDCVIWVFSCLAIILLNADMGLLAGVIFSLFLVLFRSMINPIEEAGQIQTKDSTVQLRSILNYSSAQKLHSVKILRVKTPLYFINSEIFSNTVLKQLSIIKELGLEKEAECLDENSESVASNEDSDKEAGVAYKNSNGVKGESASLFKVKVVILDLSEVSFIDVMGVKALELLIQQSSKSNTAMLFTNVPESIFSVLESTGFWKKHADRLYLTIECALSSLAEEMVEADKQNVSKL